ncbi:MAG TPA: polyprenyl diphosphate synthase [Acidimicrobiales bacterium]|nr:polyprenyl diphosphate synthase [Acidimicrobiales bacterium]
MLDDAGAATRAVPGHVAVIMDGNGRWAESKGLPRTEGHRQGEATLAEVVRAADDIGIRWFTAYGFSTENWTRPKLEVDFILSLHKKIFGRRLEMHRNNVRIRCIGRPVSRTSRLPRRILREMDESVELTKDNTGLNFTLAFDYGSREELVYATRRLLAAHRDGLEIDERALEQFLYEPAMPAVDLLVRTSGEQRLSNFLLWQAIGAPFYVTPTYWPDFDRSELEAAVRWWSEHRGEPSGAGAG